MSFIDVIAKKRDGQTLSKNDIDAFIKTYLMKKASGTLDASAAPDEE